MLSLETLTDQQKNSWHGFTMFCLTLMMHSKFALHYFQRIVILWISHNLIFSTKNMLYLISKFSLMSESEKMSRFWILPYANSAFTNFWLIKFFSLFFKFQIHMNNTKKNWCKMCVYIYIHMYVFFYNILMRNLISVCHCMKFIKFL